MEGIIAGQVVDFDDKEHVVIISLKIDLKLGDTLRFVYLDIDYTEVVDAILLNGNYVENAKVGDKIGIKTFEKILAGAKVYKTY